MHVNDDIKLNTREFGGIRKTIVARSPIGLFWPLFHTKAAVYNKAMQRPEGSSIKDVVSDSVIFDPLRSQVKKGLKSYRLSVSIAFPIYPQFKLNSKKNHLKKYHIQSCS